MSFNDGKVSSGSTGAVTDGHVLFAKYLRNAGSHMTRLVSSVLYA